MAVNHTLGAVVFYQYFLNSSDCKQAKIILYYNWLIKTISGARTLALRYSLFEGAYAVVFNIVVIKIRIIWQT
jgi:hypothetical protein